MFVMNFNTTFSFLTIIFRINRRMQLIQVILSVYRYNNNDKQSQNVTIYKATTLLRDGQSTFDNTVIKQHKQSAASMKENAYSANKLNTSCKKLMRILWRV